MQKLFLSWSAVSSLPQAEKISLSDQREVNLRHIERHGGMLVADLVVDESRDIDELSEACERIPAYAELRRMIKNREFQVLICFTRSRLGRVLALVETIAQLCRRNGIVIYETESPPANLEYEINSDTDLLTGAVRSWSAQREIDELRRRHRMGMLGKFQRGEFLSTAPWGWTITRDEKGARVAVVDAAAVSIIRTLFVELYYDKGLGAGYIAEELNRRQMFTASGKPWNAKSVSSQFRMLWRYAGYGEINIHSTERPYARTKGAWPAIITEDELHKLLEERGGRRGKRGALSKTYRFASLVWCATCEVRMQMQFTKHHWPRKDGVIVNQTYVSAACRTGSGHAKRHISFANLTRFLHDFFTRMKDRANWQRYLTDNQSDLSKIEAEATTIEKELGKTEQSIFDADDRLIDGTFDTERHSHQVKRLKARMMQLQNELTILADRKAAMQHASRRILRLEEIAEHGLRYLEMDDERAANTELRRLIKVWVEAGKVVDVEIL